MKTLVLGIGNTLLGDDGVGVYAAQALAGRISEPNITVRDIGVDGLNLLEYILGYDRLVVIDAIVTEGGNPGDIYRLKPQPMSETAGLGISPHHFNLAATLEIGNRLFPGEMPREVTAFAVEARDVKSITEEMTAEVREALPRVVEMVMEEVAIPSSSASR